MLIKKLLYVDENSYMLIKKLLYANKKLLYVDENCYMLIKKLLYVDKKYRNLLKCILNTSYTNVL